MIYGRELPGRPYNLWAKFTSCIIWGQRNLFSRLHPVAGVCPINRPHCALLAAQGFRYDPEVAQASGRSDLIAEHPSGIWSFDSKTRHLADCAWSREETLV